jgi:hypothetical protein
MERNFLLSAVPTSALGPMQLPTEWVPEVLSPRVKGQVREVDHSTPSSAEAKNDAAIPPHFHTFTWYIHSYFGFLSPYLSEPK